MPDLKAAALGNVNLSEGHLRVGKSSDENEMLIVPGENSDDCLF